MIVTEWLEGSIIMQKKREISHGKNSQSVRYENNGEDNEDQKIPI